MQAAIRRAYATERSAVAVKDWLLANCNVDLGPVVDGRAGGRAAAGADGVDRAAERLSRVAQWRDVGDLAAAGLDLVAQAVLDGLPRP